MKLLKLQTFVLFIGVIFSWFTVFTDFRRFYELYGSLTRIKDCAIPNPVTTPCFYGAFAFLLAFIWAFQILQKSRSNHDISKDQKRLWYLLIAATIFAWSNFAYGVYKFYSATTTIKVSCSGIPTENAFLTPCLYGSVIFLASLIIAKIVKKSVTTAKS